MTDVAVRRAVDGPSDERVVVVLVDDPRIEPIGPALYRDMHVVTAPPGHLAEALAMVEAEFPAARSVILVVGSADPAVRLPQFAVDPIMEEHSLVESDITPANYVATRLNHFLLAVDPRVAVH